MKKLILPLFCTLVWMFSSPVSGSAQMRQTTNQADRPETSLAMPGNPGIIYAGSVVRDNFVKVPFGPDTLLFEDFQSKVIPATWQNLDLDLHTDANGRPANWYIMLYTRDTVPGDSNWVAASSSWFSPYAQANNWLITPGLIIQSGHVLSWESAPFEGPAFMDGYKVMVSTTDSLVASFTDTLAVFAESLNGTSTPTSGIVHTNYAGITPILNQWSFGLSAYIGQRIFIAFVHDSDDDNLLMLNNICVSKPPCTLPTASFSSSPSGLTVSFTSTATSGTNPTYVWDFGDGNTSTQQNPMHTFAVGGTYTVCFIVTDSCGADTLCQPYTVTPCTIPTASFSTSAFGLTISFTSTATSGANPTYVWDFGDGNTSTQQNPMHTYATAGTYTVCFIVTDSCGADTTCQPFTVAPCTLPQAGFSHVPTGLSVVFTNTSTSGGNPSYLWDFGDGGISTLADPSHIYASNGVYTVCLIETDSCGNDSTCNVISVSSIGLNEIASELQVSIFPNPAQEEINLKFHFPTEADANIRIHDVLGNCFQENRLPQNHADSYRISVKDIESGIYFLEINTGEHTIIKRFVIMH